MTTRSDPAAGRGAPTSIARLACLLACLAACVLPGCAAAHSGAASDSASTAQAIDGYYLSTCALCGGALGARGEAVDTHHLGRPLRFCTAACAADFARGSAAAVARLDAVMIADQGPHYPTDRSLLTGRPLGERPLAFIMGNRLFLAADEAERAQLQNELTRAVARLDAAVLAAQRPIYGMPDKCPVQGDILPDDVVIDLVVANRMIRVCCARCARVVRARPYQYIAMVDYANRVAADRRHAPASPAH